MVKAFNIVSETDVDFFFFFEFPCFSYDPADVGNLLSGSSAFSKTLKHEEVHSSHIAEAWLGEF